MGVFNGKNLHLSFVVEGVKLNETPAIAVCPEVSTVSLLRCSKSLKINSWSLSFWFGLDSSVDVRRELSYVLQVGHEKEAACGGVVARRPGVSSCVEIARAGR